jgi:hypothetical protein
MSTIELDALEAFSVAIHEHGYGASGLDIVRILRNLNDQGWQLTRKPEPEPVITSVVIKDQELTGARVTWPPPGIVNLFSIVDDQAKVILSILELKHAMKEGHPLVSASRPEEALRIHSDPDNLLSTLEFSGMNIAYHEDIIPF